ncbi:MAG: hypothetical protein WA821_00400 [Anaerolineales bacterium]
MNTPEMNEIAQLSKTFSTACKKVVAEGKVVTNKAPVVTAALALLTAGAVKGPSW